jgi:hypothetical protein
MKQDIEPVIERAPSDDEQTETVKGQSCRSGNYVKDIEPIKPEPKKRGRKPKAK